MFILLYFLIINYFYSNIYNLNEICFHNNKYFLI